MEIEKEQYCWALTLVNGDNISHFSFQPFGGSEKLEIEAVLHCMLVAKEYEPSVWLLARGLTWNCKCPKFQLILESISSSRMSAEETLLRRAMVLPRLSRPRVPHRSVEFG